MFLFSNVLCNEDALSVTITRRVRRFHASFYFIPSARLPRLLGSRKKTKKRPSREPSCLEPERPPLSSFPW